MSDRPTILLVDDNALVRTVTGRMLVTGGYDVRLAENGKKAIALCREERADVVITDLLMPVMEGLETIQELRRLDPEARIIAVTVAAPERATTYLDVAETFGALKILRKPFTKVDLLAAIADVLATYR